MTQKILLTGGSGFLGAHLTKRLSQSYQVYVTRYRSPLSSGIRHQVSTIHLDITNPLEVKTTVGRIQPALIIHTAANTNLRDCEENPTSAWELNVDGTNNLVQAAKKIGARFIYLSTDSVFNGKRGFYRETDLPEPINVYGVTKLEGEKIVAAQLTNVVILRLALLYGWSLTKSTSFTEDSVNDLSAGKKINAFTDEYRNPLHVLNLCEIIGEIIENNTIQGLFHAAGPDRVNRYEQTLRIAEIFNFDQSLISPITTSEIKTLTYKRPKDCSLNTEKLRSVIKTKIWSLEEGLKEMRDTR